MIVGANTILGDTWRMGVTLLALLIISVFWYLVVSNITPFPGTKSGKTEPEGDEERPNRKYPRMGPVKYPKIQRATVIADVVLFVWIVVEGAVVIPIMLTKYGLH
jgi:hypothetical protein